MKKPILVIIGILAVLAVVFIFLKTSSDDTTTQTGKSVNIIVGPVTAMCQSVGPMRCLQVKESPEGDWQNLFGQIAGFTHETGYEYVLRVREEKVENLPADGSSIKLVLEEEIAKEAVPYVTIDSPADFANIPANEEFTVSGTGMGLFEGNVVVQIGSETDIITEEITTMQTEEIGGEGEWQVTSSVSLVDNTSGIISAFSPSPKDGEPGLRYSIPVLFTVADGMEYSLEGTNWVLTNMQEEDLSFRGSASIPDTLIAALFEDGNLNGSSGCNNYSTSYEVDGNNISISDTIALTRMACPEPIMDQEQVYLARLAEAATYSVRGIELLIMNDLGESLLVFNVNI